MILKIIEFGNMSMWQNYYILGKPTQIDIQLFFESIGVMKEEFTTIAYIYIQP